MDRDTVVRLAEQCGLMYPRTDTTFRFATLIANETLERAAKAADVIGDYQVASAIRALKERT